ncbi:MAG: lysophospholipid acyltransferase family protein [Pseudobdellovibrionaceae bacterium]
MQLIEPPSMERNLKSKNPFLLAHWHGDEIALIQLARRYRIATMSSQSKDGQMMSIILRLLGAKTSQGSSTRGGVGGLKGLIRLIREGHNCSFAVDGPKGPIYKVKPGIFEISRLLNCPIYYCGVSVNHAVYFPKAWNKTYFPKPFSKIVIQWHEPLPPLTKDQDPRDPKLSLELENLLHCAKQQALKVIAES